MLKNTHIVFDGTNARTETYKNCGALARLSVRSIVDFLQGDVKKTSIYGKKTSPSNSYYENMRKEGYRVKEVTQPLRKNGERAEKGVDAKIILDTYSDIIHEKPDMIVIISGDGDFTPLVLKAKEFGVTVQIWAFRSSIAYSLWQAADQFRALDDFVEKFVFYKKEPHAFNAPVIDDEPKAEANTNETNSTEESPQVDNSQNNKNEKSSSKYWKIAALGIVCVVAGLIFAGAHYSTDTKEGD